jgi:NIPSNAP protein
VSAVDRRSVLAGSAALASLGATTARASDGVCRIVELRQYAMQPGRRDDMIALFEREFIETQEAVGMTVIGQFRDLDRPDRFVWMRGFPDMTARTRSLEAFYGGPVWKAHRTAANATIVDSDNVLLLHPAVGAFEAPRDRPAPGSDRPAGLITAEIHYLTADGEASFPALFERRMAPAMRQAGARIVGGFATEHSPNTYPRLPVREGERVFVVVSAFAGPSAHDAYRRRLDTPAWRRDVAPRVAKLSHKAVETLRLDPTRRSALR